MGPLSACSVKGLEGGASGGWSCTGDIVHFVLLSVSDCGSAGFKMKAERMRAYCLGLWGRSMLVQRFYFLLKTRADVF